MKIPFFLSLVLFISSTSAILPDVGGDGETKRNVFVKMAQGPEPILAGINSGTFSSREEKITAMTNALQSHAALTQGPLVDFLSSPAAALAGKPMNVETMWISNSLYLQGVNSGLLSALTTAFPSQIASIEDEKFFSISPVIEVKAEEFEGKQGGRTAWGVSKIQAPQVWQQGTRGQGIVVGVIDTGVRGTHEALKDNYLGAYGWFDPSGRTSTPNDGNGHGTHCAGTILGKNNIGVAPDAKWSACKGCGSSSCSMSDLERCGQFMTCPTDTQGNNKNCGKAPHIVSNSWGGGRDARSYSAVIDAWRTAGIIPIFAAGNAGQCASASSPGINPNVIAVGSTTSSDELSSFSSRGPGLNNLMKPELSAPGSNVYSASWSGDRSYTTMSGTSMACPHVAGLAALVLSANEDLNFDQVKNALVKGCVTNNLKVPNPRCPRGSSGRYTYPNNDYGQGLINAVNSVRLAES